MRTSLALAVLCLSGSVVLTGCSGGEESFEDAPVLLISIDTLRSDHLPAYGYGGVETPALDAFREDAILFERAYSHTPLTLPSHATLLSGVLPTVHQVRDNGGYKVDTSRHPWLPSLLGEAGYATGAAVSAFVLGPETGMGTGFDLYDAGSEQERAESARAQLPGGRAARAAVEWIRGQGENPFLYFLHLYEPHTPYEPPEPFATRYRDRPYDGEIAAADAILGGLFEELKRLGVYDRAVILVLSDHGEGLGDHGEEEHGLFLYRETLQVPLLLKLPGARRGGTSVAAPAQLLDVAPTVLRLAGLPVPDGLEGKSLLELEGGGAEEPARRIYAETFYPRLHFGWSDLASLIEDRFHYIHGPAPELFDLAADPAETRDRLPAERRVYAALRQALEGYDRRLAEPGHVDAETARQLRALGYSGRPSLSAEGPLPDPRQRRHVIRDFEAAQQAVSQARYEEGAEIVRRVLREEPRMLDAWVFLGICSDRLGRGEEALAAYREALEISGGAPEYALEVGRQLFKLGRPEEALRHAALGEEADPAEARGLMAAVALTRRDTDEALRLLRAGGRVGASFRRDLGLALAESGRTQEALEVLAPAGGSPADPASLNTLALTLSEAGRQREAAEVLRSLLATAPDNARAHELLGMISLRQGDARQARLHLDRALAIDRGRPAAWNTLGVALYELEGPEAALAAWRQALALDATQYDALLNIGLVTARAGRTGEAREALRRFVATAPPQRFAADLDRARQLLREIGSR